MPDAKGEVNEIDFVKVEVDGREYEIRRDVQSFITYTGKVTPLLSWKGKYVHIGLDEDRKVLWVAGIGVIDKTADPPVVFYTNGVFLRVTGKRLAVFRDGTVLQLAEGLDPPPANTRVTAKIDASEDLVVEFSITGDA